jgi:hypothetical protein
MRQFLHVPIALTISSIIQQPILVLVGQLIHVKLIKFAIKTLVRNAQVVLPVAKYVDIN